MEKALLKVTRFNNSDVIATSGDTPSTDPPVLTGTWVGVCDGTVGNAEFTGTLPYGDNTEFCSDTHYCSHKFIKQNDEDTYSVSMFKGNYTWNGRSYVHD